VQYSRKNVIVLNSADLQPQFPPIIHNMAAYSLLFEKVKSGYISTQVRSIFPGMRKVKTKNTLADLRVGEEAIIKSFSNQDISLKLMEMGCLPGEKICLERIAPLGDPILISVAGYMLSMRKDEAATVNIVPYQS
jgi:ferrous iron transport protein A